jgi:hypothetical protein
MPKSPFFVLDAIYEIIIFFIRALFTGKDPILLLKEEEQKQQQEFDEMLQNDPNPAAKELLLLLSKQRESYKVDHSSTIDSIKT